MKKSSQVEWLSSTTGATKRVAQAMLEAEAARAAREAAPLKPPRVVPDPVDVAIAAATSPKPKPQGAGRTQ